ncbi:hypothetical protein [Methylobacterium sp. A54F]
MNAPTGRPLPPLQAIALAARLLEAASFAEAARNARGDSRYLRPAGCPFSLRVSNHARTPKQRRGHPEVLASLVIRAPRTAAQVAALVEAALRDFGANRARREGLAQPSAGALK